MESANKGVNLCLKDIAHRMRLGKDNIRARHVTYIYIYLFLQDFLGKSDPYLEIQRPTPDGSWQIVHRTEVLHCSAPFTVKGL